MRSAQARLPLQSNHREGILFLKWIKEEMKTGSCALYHLLVANVGLVMKTERFIKIICFPRHAVYSAPARKIKPRLLLVL